MQSRYDFTILKSPLHPTSINLVKCFLPRLAAPPSQQFTKILIKSIPSPCTSPYLFISNLGLVAAVHVLLIQQTLLEDAHETLINQIACTLHKSSERTHFRENLD